MVLSWGSACHTEGAHCGEITIQQLGLQGQKRGQQCFEKKRSGSYHYLLNLHSP